MSLVKLPAPPKPEKPSPYVSRERVYGENEQGLRVLLYPVGHPIPFEEAVRQGLVAEAEQLVEQPEPEVEPKEAEPEADKAHEPEADKAVRPTTNKSRRRQTSKE